ncbi:hypothetical protein FPS14_contig00075-0003 [Flavobacterium psychrophilum]|nr:hypothetical protein FPS14_contig00075-0003 [Flavobacterium psychrophilum]
MQACAFFEGTNVSVGRGTEKQFQVYGSPYLEKKSFSFTPIPNFGSKDPLWKGKECFGEDLSAVAKVKQLELKWLIRAYKENSGIMTPFFNGFFTKLAGTKNCNNKLKPECLKLKLENLGKADWLRLKK